jgi:group I intron endonuclease
LTDIETVTIRSFPFDDLYNFKKDAKSMLGYKHTEEAINKMKLRLSNKANHPMCGKKHSQNALRLISKPGKLNPKHNKTHSAISKKKYLYLLAKLL